MTITRSDRRRFTSLIGSSLNLDEVARAAGDILPVSSVVMRLTQTLARNDWTPTEVADIVRVDPALTARLLKVANSAHYAPRKEIATVGDALMRIGPGVAVALAVSDSVRGPFHDELPMFGLKSGDLWRHAVAAALSTEESSAACGKPAPAEAYAAALLHDVGMIVLSRMIDGDTIERLVERAGVLGIGPQDARTVVFDVCHAELGGRLVRQWGLPQIISEAIRHHHAPLMAGDPKTRRLCLQLQLGDTVAELAGAGCDESKPPSFNAALAGSLQIWRQSFDDLVERVSERLDDVLELYS